MCFPSPTDHPTENYVIEQRIIIEQDFSQTLEKYIFIDFKLKPKTEVTLDTCDTCLFLMYKELIFQVGTHHKEKISEDNMNISFLE